MTPVELAKLWQDGLKEAYGDGQRWDKLSQQQRDVNIRVAVKVLERLACEKSTLDLIDQAKLASSLAMLDEKVSRLQTEVFSARIISHSGRSNELANERQTLRGRVNELSAMAALGEIEEPHRNE